MAKANERTYATIFSEEALPMDKYNELLRDIARLIADTDRENFLLKCELDGTKQRLAAAEEQLETVVAKRAVEMLQEVKKDA